MHFRNKSAAALVLAAVFSASGAQAACWSDEAAQAAQVRDLDTMLMVSSLRCHLKGVEFIPAYNEFVANNRDALVEANNRIQTHFTGKGGASAYDSYVTKLANSYGAGAKDISCAELADMATTAANLGGGYANLTAYVRSEGHSPELPDGRCALVVANR
jgi:hypothetical protein